MKLIPICLLIIQMLVYSQDAYGKIEVEPAVLGATPGQVSLDGHIEFLEDKNGLLTIEQVAASTDFSYAGEDTPNFGFSDSVYWFRFSVNNQSGFENFLLEIGYPLLDYVELFEKSGEGFASQSSGDMLVFSERARGHRTITFSNHQLPVKAVSYFLRVQTSSSIQVPIRAYTEESFFRMNSKEDSALLAYYSAILIMILFNFVLGLSLRDRIYIVYIGFLSSFVLLQLILNGNGHRWLFPSYPVISNTMLPVSIFVTFGFGYTFSRKFLDLSEVEAPIGRFLDYGRHFCWVMVLVSLFTPYSTVIKVCVLTGLVSPVSWMIAGILSYRSGFLPARSYLVAWVTLLLGGMTFALKTAGLVPVNTFTNYAMQFGSAVEVVLLSLALAERIHVFQASSLESQEKLIAETTARNEAEKRLNQSLSSRLFLFSDLAHRINNPLNVALGGAQVGRDTGEELVEKVIGFFPEPGHRSVDEQKVVVLIEGMGARIESGFDDTSAELNKAVRYVKDLRVIGGVDGADAKRTSLSDVVKSCFSRVKEEVGEKALNIESDGSLDGVEVVGHPALLAVGLAPWIKHCSVRAQKDESLLMTAEEGVESGYIQLVLTPQISPVFTGDYDEDVPTKDIVLGLLESQGAQWGEDLNPDGSVVRLRLRLAATEDAWLKAQGGENRK